MSDIDHKTEAESMLLYSADMNPAVTGERAMHALGIAQVHATLYLAEQQRIGNLIAIAGWAEETSVHEEFAEEALDKMTDSAPRKALGLS